MKKYILILLSSIFLCSCQKEDKNGDFGGMWKLLEIEKSDGSVINRKEGHYFWCVQLKLITIGGQYGRFQNRGDSLFIQMIDPECPSLKNYGVYNNSNEGFEIIKLNRSRMTLKSDSVKLQFRKF